MRRTAITDEIPEPMYSALVALEERLWGLAVEACGAQRDAEAIPRTGAGGADHRKMLAALRVTDTAVDEIRTAVEDAYHKLQRVQNGWRQRNAA